MSPRRHAALRIGAWGVLLGTCVIYALALNPHVLPATYDNVLYHEAGRALAETGSYTFGGWSIWDWPPGFAVMLAAPMVLGFQSVLASKLVVYATVAVAAALALKILRREERPWAILSVSLGVLVPTAFLQGTRVMSDWPFAAFGFLFLYLLDRPRGPRADLAWAPVLGLVLGAGALTRHVGVCLGAALVVHAWRRMRDAGEGRRLRAAVPDAITAVLGGAIFVGWRLWLLPHLEAAEAWADYQQGLSFVEHLSFVSLSHQVWDITMHGTWVFERVVGGGAGAVGSALAIAVTLLVAYGGYRQIRSHGLRPSDAYVMATVALVATIEWKHARYLIPVAPFLASYLTWGIEKVFGRLWARRERQRWWAVRSAVGVWLLALLAMDAYLVVCGNDDSHRGLSPLASPTAASFYVGEWHDLERASAHIRSDPRPGTVLVLGRDDLKYPAFFTERPIARLPERGGAVVIPPDTRLCDLRPPFRPGDGLTLTDETGRPTPPLWAGPSGRRPTGRPCALSHVLVQGAALPAAVAAALPVSEPKPFGAFRVYDVLP